MDRTMRLARLRADQLPGPAAADRLGEGLHKLSGYILEHTAARAPQGMVIACRVVMFGALPFDEPRPATETPIHPPRQPRGEASRRAILQLKPVGRLVPLSAPLSAPGDAPEAPPAVRPLRPVCSGRAYRITSAPARGLVTPGLADALESVFEHFAHECRFTPENPLDIQLARGFTAGSPGHGEGRAADIAGVAGKSLAKWKQAWDQATAGGDELSAAEQRGEAIAAEQKRNLGFGLYKALQGHGGWRVDKDGWRPYRGVTQLFGPWTAMRIKDPSPSQQRRLADQQWVFQAHRDHIHVAR
jgi:hypothetical protein